MGKSICQRSAGKTKTISGLFVETRPTSGEVGTKVIILGTNLEGATSVTFNGVQAVFKVLSSSEITTTVPKSAATGRDVTTKIIETEARQGCNSLLRLTNQEKGDKICPSLEYAVSAQKTSRGLNEERIYPTLGNALSQSLFFAVIFVACLLLGGTASAAPSITEWTSFSIRRTRRWWSPTEWESDKAASMCLSWLTKFVRSALNSATIDTSPFRLTLGSEES
jgi:hypothetical protein